MGYVNSPMDMSGKGLTEVEKEAQEMVKNYFESDSADAIQKLFKSEDSVLEAILYTFYTEAVGCGDLMPTTYLHQATPEEEHTLGEQCKCSECGGDGVHASPVFLAPAITLRHMMHSAMCIGIHYQQNISKLDNIWGAK